MRSTIYFVPAGDTNDEKMKRKDGRLIWLHRVLTAVNTGWAYHLGGAKARIANSRKAKAGKKVSPVLLPLHLARPLMPADAQAVLRHHSQMARMMSNKGFRAPPSGAHAKARMLPVTRFDSILALAKLGPKTGLMQKLFGA